MIGVKLNIAKKTAGLKIMILNLEKMWHVSDLTELMPNGGGGGALHCLLRCLRKQTSSEDV